MRWSPHSVPLPSVRPFIGGVGKEQPSGRQSGGGKAPSSRDAEGRTDGWRGGHGWHGQAAQPSHVMQKGWLDGGRRRGEGRPRRTDRLTDEGGEIARISQIMLTGGVIRDHTEEIPLSGRERYWFEGADRGGESGAERGGWHSCV